MQIEKIEKTCPGKKRQNTKSSVRFLPKILLAGSLLLASGCGEPVNSTTVSTPDHRSCQEKYDIPPRINPFPDQVALTPPMGFNGFNSFGYDVTDALIRQVADKMAVNCMRDAGYEYINLDEGWEGNGRDQNDQILIDKMKFPEGIKSLADYVHEKGFKFGIYTSIGGKGCDSGHQREGSLNHEKQDAKTFASWGVDFLKLDWCPPGNDYSSSGALKIAQKWRQAVDETGRPMVISISTGGGGEPWTWPAGTVNLWRVSHDIRPSWNKEEGSILRILNDPRIGLSATAAGPGHFSDLDMLEVGRSGLTNEEAKTQFSLWAINASPLLAGNDVRSMNEETSEVLLNPEVIAIDQDPLGIQGRLLKKTNGIEFWVKQLKDPDSEAIAILNTNDKLSQIKINWRDLGLIGDISARDLWLHKDLDASKDLLPVSIPPHGTVLIKVTGS